MKKLIWWLIRIYQKLPKNIFLGIPQKIFVKFNLYKFLGRNEIVTATRDGITYELDLNELMDSTVFHTGSYEPQTKDVVRKYCKPDMTIFDIGANSGFYTLQFAKLLNNSGKVIAFEPMTWAHAKLKRNIALNAFSNITTEKLALSDVNEKKAVNFKASWPLNEVTHQNRCAQEIEEVVFITMDEYIKKNAIPWVDFMKLDVDGHEHKVLLGARESITKFKPVMIVELFKPIAKDTENSLEKLIDLLISLDYLIRSQKTFKEYKDKKTLLNTFPEGESINVLCTPK